jgi:hypothetical protein
MRLLLPQSAPRRLRPMPEKSHARHRHARVGERCYSVEEDITKPLILARLASVLRQQSKLPWNHIVMVRQRGLGIDRPKWTFYW